MPKVCQLQFKVLPSNGTADPYALTITNRIFHMKNPGRILALHAAERAGCLNLAFWNTLVVSLRHVTTWLCSRHSCSSTKDWTLIPQISLKSSSSSTSCSDLWVVTVMVKSWRKRTPQNDTTIIPGCWVEIKMT